MKGKLLYEVFECLVDISIAVIAVVALSLALSHGEVHRDGISQSVCDGVSEKSYLDLFPVSPPTQMYLVSRCE